MQCKASRPARSGRQAGRIVAVFGVLVLGLILAGIAAGAAFVRSIPPLRDMSELRADLLEALDIGRTTEIEITVPAWATVLGRVGAAFAKPNAEVCTVLQALQSGQIGAYKLERVPRRQEALALLHMADARLEGRGWTRTVTVMEKSQMVAVYVPDTPASDEQHLEALVIVQDHQDLVLVSARGRSAPLLELARKAITPGGLAKVQF